MCPVCLKKLAWNLHLDVRQRYARLLAYCTFALSDAGDGLASAHPTLDAAADATWHALALSRTCAL